MVNVNELRPGDRLVYRWDDFDGRGEKEVTVMQVFDGYAFADSDDGMDLLVDKYNSDMFERR